MELRILRKKFSRAFYAIRNRVFPFPIDRWIAGNSRPALYLSKTYPKPGALSFFGGSPIAPPDFAWPVDDSLGVAKPFLGQIHMPDLKGPLPDEMPRQGILYFFLDLAMLEGGKSDGNVIYIETVNDMRVIEPPMPVPPLGDGSSSLNGGWTFSWDSADWQPFAMDRFPKFDLAFLPFFDIDAPEYSPRITDDVYDKINALIRSAIQGAIQQHYGPEESALRSRRSHTDFEFSSLLDERYMMYVRSVKQFGGISPLYAQWPHAWGSVGLYLSRFFERERYGKKPPQHPLYGAFVAECREWTDRAKREGFYVALKPEERDQFRAWVREKQRKHFLGWSSDMNSEEGQAHQKIWSGLEHNFHGSAQDAIAYYVSTNERHVLLDQAAQNDFLGLMESSPPHQMFGYGFDYQRKPEECAGKYLLLQLNSDYPMMWMFADSGNLQFWIDPQDLAARRFDKVIVTMDGG